MAEGGEENSNYRSRQLDQLRKVFGVSYRIQSLAMRQRISPRKVGAKEIEKATLGKSKEKRQKRVSLIGPRERFILEIVAEYFNIDPDECVEGVVDADEHIELMEKFFVRDGSMAVMFFYRNLKHPPLGK